MEEEQRPSSSGLPPIDTPATGVSSVNVESLSLTVVKDEQEPTKHKRRHSTRRQSHKGPIQLPDVNLDPTLIRSFDQSQNIYYYNTITEVSTWLAPCCFCQKPADRWCLDCQRSYCDHDYVKKHDKYNMKDHKWQFKEALPPVKLQPGEEYCIACKSKAAFKMCLNCCDPYCLACFGLVHHVGALKAHKAMPINRYKMGWMTIRNHADRIDTFVNGTTGETMEDKPIELLSEWEKTTLENIKSHKEAVLGYLETLEKLRAELVVVRKERDRAVVETTKTISELRAKAEAKTRMEEAASAKEKSMKG